MERRRYGTRVAALEASEKIGTQTAVMQTWGEGRLRTRTRSTAFADFYNEAGIVLSYSCTAERRFVDEPIWPRLLCSPPDNDRARSLRCRTRSTVSPTTAPGTNKAETARLLKASRKGRSSTSTRQRIATRCKCSTCGVAVDNLREHINHKHSVFVYSPVLGKSTPTTERSFPEKKKPYTGAKRGPKPYTGAKRGRKPYTGAKRGPKPNSAKKAPSVEEEPEIQIIGFFEKEKSTTDESGSLPVRRRKKKERKAGSARGKRGRDSSGRFLKSATKNTRGRDRFYDIFRENGNGPSNNKRDIYSAKSASSSVRSAGVSSSGTSLGQRVRSRVGREDSALLAEEADNSSSTSSRQSIMISVFPESRTESLSTRRSSRRPSVLMNNTAVNAPAGRRRHLGTPFRGEADPPPPAKKSVNRHRHDSSGTHTSDSSVAYGFRHTSVPSSSANIVETSRHYRLQPGVGAQSGTGVPATSGSRQWRQPLPPDFVRRGAPASAPSLQPRDRVLTNGVISRTRSIAATDRRNSTVATTGLGVARPSSSLAQAVERRPVAEVSRRRALTTSTSARFVAPSAPDSRLSSTTDSITEQLIESFARVPTEKLAERMAKLRLLINRRYAQDICSMLLTVDNASRGSLVADMVKIIRER